MLSNVMSDIESFTWNLIVKYILQDINNLNNHVINNSQSQLTVLWVKICEVDLIITIYIQKYVQN